MKIHRWPWVSLALTVLQSYVYLCERKAHQWGLLNAMVDDYSFRWSAFVQQPLAEFPRLISCVFLHANWSHLIGNLAFFLFFAFSVETAIGSIWFLIGYFFWGSMAALCQGFFSPFDTGLIGASGAISGVAGAFFVLFPLQRPFGKVPAFFLIGLWFLGQLNDGLRLLSPDPLAGQVVKVAYWAHIGGFAVGAVSMVPVIFPFPRRK